jgi:hypothetical protein
MDRMPSRILVFLCLQAVVAVPAILARERWLRAIGVGILLAVSFAFGIVMPGVEMRAAMSHIRAVELTKPLTPEELREIIMSDRYGIALLQLALCFWLAVLAMIPLRGRKNPSILVPEDLGARRRDRRAV